MDQLQALHAGTVRPLQGKSAAHEGPYGEIRGSGGSPIRMRDMDPSKGQLQQYPQCTSQGVASNQSILGVWCESPNNRILSYKDALRQNGCESIEATVRARRLLWTGALLRTGDHRLPNSIMSGELENAGKCYVVSHIQCIGCRPEKKHCPRWPIPLGVS